MFKPHLACDADIIKVIRRYKMKTRKLIFGIGISDADYVVKKWETIGYVNGKRQRKLIWRCRFYQVWKSMLARCYSTNYQEQYPTYKGCSVSEEWLTFSNFKRWMEAQDWEGKQLDKDLLFEGNKVYSAETCVFVTGMVNTFIVDCKASRGEWMVGAYWESSSSKFVSWCCNPFTKKREFLGRFHSEQESHNAWLKRKLELAHELAAIQTDSRVAKALITRYLNYKS